MKEKTKTLLVRLIIKLSASWSVKCANSWWNAPSLTCLCLIIGKDVDKRISNPFSSYSHCHVRWEEKRCRHPSSRAEDRRSERRLIYVRSEWGSGQWQARSGSLTANGSTVHCVPVTLQTRAFSKSVCAGRTLWSDSGAGVTTSSRLQTD